MTFDNTVFRDITNSNTFMTGGSKKLDASTSFVQVNRNEFFPKTEDENSLVRPTLVPKHLN